MYIRALPLTSANGSSVAGNVCGLSLVGCMCSVGTHCYCTDPQVQEREIEVRGLGEM